MNRQAVGRVLLLLGFAAALAVVWATWQPDRFAALTAGLAPPVTLAALALVFGLAGALLSRQASAPPPRRAPPPPEPAARMQAPPQPDPEDSVETIRRRLREADEKER
jgi:type VI protein secretion system component VasK